VSQRTLSIQGKIQVLDLAELAEDLTQMAFVDVLGQPLDDNL